MFGCCNDKFGGNGSVMRLQDLCAQPPAINEVSDIATVPKQGYLVTGGLRAEQAVALFKKFYARENTRAPVPKKRRDGEAAGSGGASV